MHPIIPYFRSLPSSQLAMLSALISRVISLGLGTLYPAYASYKAVRTKNVKEYVKWMMYWIVFALFTSVETFSDFMFSFWFPFYYEIKIIFLIWLLSPATKGSSLLYRKFVHPQLLRREQKIDEMIVAAQTRSYDTAMQLGHRGVRYVTGLIMDQAVRAPAIMQDIIAGAGVAEEAGGQRYESGTIQEIHEGAANIELSDDEAGEAGARGRQEEVMDVTDGAGANVSNESGRSTKVTRRGRPKKTPVDMTFSSGKVNLRKYRNKYLLYVSSSKNLFYIPNIFKEVNLMETASSFPHPPPAELPRVEKQWQERLRQELPHPGRESRKTVTS